MLLGTRNAELSVARDCYISSSRVIQHPTRTTSKSRTTKVASIGGKVARGLNTAFLETGRGLCRLMTRFAKRQKKEETRSRHTLMIESVTTAEDTVVGKQDMKLHDSKNTVFSAPASPEISLALTWHEYIPKSSSQSLMLRGIVYTVPSICRQTAIWYSESYTEKAGRKRKFERHENRARAKDSEMPFLLPIYRTDISDSRYITVNHKDATNEEKRYLSEVPGPWTDLDVWPIVGLRGASIDQLVSATLASVERAGNMD
ncbi:hypothetical protein WG66_016568 [Moniliophthora roreri]|nr:hypothetical protein WG66_016568 [Moniliophthora roreri]